MDAKKINAILNDFEDSNPELYQHSERVAMIAYSFAQELKLEFEEREIAYFSGLLHDIGKFYLEDVAENNENEMMNQVINGSILYLSDDFSKLIPIISNLKQLNDNDSEKYDYNINVIKLIIILTDEYDNCRLSGLSHEKTCEKIRSNNQKYNNMVTTLFKSIIKNKLNYEYNL